MCKEPRDQQDSPEGRQEETEMFLTKKDIGDALGAELRQLTRVSAEWTALSERIIASKIADS